MRHPGGCATGQRQPGPDIDRSNTAAGPVGCRSFGGEHEHHCSRFAVATPSPMSTVDQVQEARLLPGFGPRLMFAAGYVGRLLAVGLVLGSALFVGGLTQISLNDYLRPPRVTYDTTPASVGLNYRDATLLTEDGLHLAAWFVPGSLRETQAAPSLPFNVRRRLRRRCRSTRPTMDRRVATRRVGVSTMRWLL
jgi:hypothetical protein